MGILLLNQTQQHVLFVQQVNVDNDLQFLHVKLRGYVGAVHGQSSWRLSDRAGKQTMNVRHAQHSSHKPTAFTKLHRLEGQEDMP